MRAWVVVLMLAAPLAAANAQRFQNAESVAWVILPGVSGEHEVRVVAPANFLQQLSGGTLRELELEVTAGPLADALARAHETRTRLPMMVLTWGGIQVEVKTVQVTLFKGEVVGVEPAFSRATIQFHSHRSMTNEGMRVH